MLSDCEGITAIALDPDNTHQAVVSCETSFLHPVNTETLQATCDTVPVHSYITSLSWQPPVSNSHSTEDLILVGGCSDGHFIMFKRITTGKYKKIVAHEGAVTCVKWSPDGTSLLTSGEDGEVKVWSQTGHLRSIMTRLESAVNSMSWNHDSSTVVAAHNASLSIHHVQNNGKSFKWNVTGSKEKSAVILAVDWNSQSNLIVCGGEDCKYHVFDSRGALLMTSHPLSHPITSIAWLPDGEAFVIGSFGTIGICDKGGEDLKCIDVGSKSSVIDIKCSKDSAQVFGSCSNGLLLVGHVLAKVLEWNGIVVEQVDPNQLRIDIMNDKTNEFVQVNW